MKITKENCESFRDIIESFCKLRDEFFYNENTSLAIKTFKILKNLRKTSKHYVKTSPPSADNFKNSIQKSIKLAEELLSDKQIYEITREPLREIKEELESLYIVIALL